MTSAALPLHLGGLHAYEQVLVLVLALGPFLVLGVVIAVRRRQDDAEEENQTDPPLKPTR
jgi:Na+-translocating ferredoxin:NAD+ oxidoreductase RnfE subunit